MLSDHAPLIGSKKEGNCSSKYALISIGFVSFVGFIWFLLSGGHTIHHHLQVTVNQEVTSSTSSTPRVVMYYSPSDDEANSLDLSELSEDGVVYVTHIELSTFHLKEYSDSEYIRLNDYSYDNEMFDEVKEKLSTLQSDYGVKVILMLGGWESYDGVAPFSSSSFINLFRKSSTFYSKLLTLLKENSFDGIDLDIEDYYNNDVKKTQKNYIDTITLISKLKRDMGDDFLVIMSPVASAIYDDDSTGGLSNMNYKSLLIDSDASDKIDFLNMQFYGGWGTLKQTTEYDSCIDLGYDSSKLVATMYAPQILNKKKVQNTIKGLYVKYGDDFGGLALLQGNSKYAAVWAERAYSYFHEDESETDSGDDDDS